MHSTVQTNDNRLYAVSNVIIYGSRQVDQIIFQMVFNEGYF